MEKQKYLGKYQTKISVYALILQSVRLFNVIFAGIYLSNIFFEKRNS